MRALAMLAAVLTVSALPFTARADDDAVNGAALARARCLNCHTAEPGANKVGPSLFGIVGRAAGTVPGFGYSSSYPRAGKAGLVWTPQAIRDYLADPKEYIRAAVKDPGARSRMTFRLRNEQERADIVAYLRTLR